MGWRVHTPPVHQVAYGTPVGALETASLADGSEATLSSDSRIVVALSRSERRIDLQRGEAFFHAARDAGRPRSEEHTSELQSLMRISYAVFCLKKKTNTKTTV